MSEHMPLAFALQERVMLYADAVFGRMFQVAEGFMAEGTDA